MKTTDLMNDHQKTEQNAEETREPWERPSFTRLAIQSTDMEPGIGADGGTGFNTLGS